MVYRYLRLIFLPILLLGCSFQATPPLIKIGIAAPFEGQYRSIGYDALWAVKLALQEVNANGGVGGYRIELVALNDNGDPQEAARQAYELTLDPKVVAVIGHFREETTLAAMETYHQGGLALIAPEISSATTVDPQFVARYQALAGGAPGPWALSAYQATKILLQAIEEAIARDGPPSREGVIRALYTLENSPGSTKTSLLTIEGIGPKP